MDATTDDGPRRGVSEMVLEHLRQGIKDGTFAPGQRLVEGDLTREYSVSRGTVRQALGRLATEGLVDLIPHRGAAVRQMTPSDVAELFAVREILESGTARLAAENAAASALRDELQAEIAAQRQWTEATDIPGYAAANERVHRLLINMADNRLLADLIGQLRTKAWRTQVSDALSVSTVRESSRQHVEVLEAVLAGDAERAETLMRRHIHTTAEHSTTWTTARAEL
jgi:DNA-binding GntR family transcriptional regulator